MKTYIILNIVMFVCFTLDLYAQDDAWQKNEFGDIYSYKNVGIGLSYPKARLDVNGNIRINNTFLIEGTSPIIKFINTSVGQRNFRIVNANDYLQFQLLDGEDWSTGDPSIPLRIRKDGKVEFGTKLENQEVYFSGLLNTKKLSIRENMNIKGASPYIRFFNQSNPNNNTYKIINSGGKLQFQTLDFGGSYLFSPMTIFDNGNIEMGTDKDITLTVHGNIITEDVLIKDLGGDDVFYADYKLLSLDEVRSFIEKNKHLPGIPPASETEKGVKLGEFNELLLKKIEEITLYLIDQNKRIDSLKKEQKEIRSLIENGNE